MGYTLQTPPEQRVLTAAQLRGHLRITHTQFDADVLEPLIDDATAFIESRLQIQLCPATWKLNLHRFPTENCDIELKRPPVREITSVKYYDSNGVQITMGGADYQLDETTQPAVLRPAVDTSWPTTQPGKLNAVEIIFEAGSLSENDVPPEARRAVKFLAGHWFLHPEAVGSVGTEVELAFNDCENALKWIW